MLELRDCHRYDKGKSNVVPIAIGDVVVVHSEERPRGFWKLARVEDTIIGRDGQTRGAVVRVHAKGNRTLILQRPIQRLYPLEINCHIEDSKEDELHISENVSISNQEETTMVECQHSTDDARLTRRPRRAAALKARDRVNACMYELNS